MCIISYAFVACAVVITSESAAAIIGTRSAVYDSEQEGNLRFGEHEEEGYQDPDLRFGLTEDDTSDGDFGAVGGSEEEGEIELGDADTKGSEGSLRFGRRKREVTFNPDLRIGKRDAEDEARIKVSKRKSTKPPHLRVGRR